MSILISAPAHSTRTVIKVKVREVSLPTKDTPARSGSPIPPTTAARARAGMAAAASRVRETSRTPPSTATTSRETTSVQLPRQGKPRAELTCRVAPTSTARTPPASREAGPSSPSMMPSSVERFLDDWITDLTRFAPQAALANRHLDFLGQQRQADNQATSFLQNNYIMALEKNKRLRKENAKIQGRMTVMRGELASYQAQIQSLQHTVVVQDRKLGWQRRTQGGTVGAPSGGPPPARGESVASRGGRGHPRSLRGQQGGSSRPSKGWDGEGSRQLPLMERRGGTPPPAQADSTGAWAPGDRTPASAEAGPSHSGKGKGKGQEKDSLDAELEAFIQDRPAETPTVSTAAAAEVTDEVDEAMYESEDEGRRGGEEEEYGFRSSWSSEEGGCNGRYSPGQRTGAL